MIAHLKPYSEMKNSGVPWLGAVPTHWRTHPVRRYCRVFAGATPSRSVAHYWENGSIPWLSSGDVNLRRIRTARQFITDAGLKNSSANWIRPGSLVVALAGQGKTKGMVATVEVSTTCNQSLAVIEPADSESRYEYLAYYLESRYQDIRALVGDGLRDGLNLEHVRSIPTPLPPLPEQAAIVRFLDHADRRIRRYLRAQQQLIALLEEQKQATIHQAVTGQIDVRTGKPYQAYKDSRVEWLDRIPQRWRAVSLGRPNSGSMRRTFWFRAEVVALHRRRNSGCSASEHRTRDVQRRRYGLHRAGALCNFGRSLGSAWRPPDRRVGRSSSPGGKGMRCAHEHPSSYGEGRLLSLSCGPGGVSSGVRGSPAHCNGSCRVRCTFDRRYAPTNKSPEHNGTTRGGSLQVRTSASRRVLHRRESSTGCGPTSRRA